MRAAVIGAGQIAKQHLGALAKCKGVEVVGVCDISPVMAESAAERFRVASWYTDYHRLLDEARPNVVHIVTPPATHFAIARDCLQAGANVFVEKPVTAEMGELDELFGIAAASGLRLLEDHNYRFNHQIQTMLRMVDAGDFGKVRHVDVDICLAIGNGAGSSGASKTSAGQPAKLGLVADFLTHLCYLGHAFIGDHEHVSTSRRLSESAGGMTDNLQALVEGETATARLGFSSDSQPDCFRVRVQGTRMSAEANLFEMGLVKTELLGGPKPLMPIRNMLRRGWAERANAARSLKRKLGGGPGPYEGLWELVRRYYDSLMRGVDAPIATQEILAVNRLYHEVLNGATTPCAC